MNKIILVSSILLVVFAACNSPVPNEESETEKKNQPSEGIATKPSREILDTNSIRQEYEDIVKAIENGKLRSTSVEFDCNGEKTGRITYYFEEDKVRMVEKSYNEYSHRDAIEQYFVANDQPFFMFFKVTDWVFDSNGSGVADATIDKIKENRYYFVNDSLVSCLEKKYVIRSTSSENPKPEEVENKTIDCPSAGELLTKYQKLLGYSNEEGKIGCL